MIRVVTTFSRKQWDDYVHRLLPKSIELWPKEVEWQVWLDDRDPLPFHGTGLGGNHKFLFLSDDPEHEAFMAGWRRRLECDTVLHAKITKFRYPFGYVHDAGTFAHKVFALTSKEARDGADWLVFLGSDVETLRPVDLDWLGRALAGDIVHLGRADIRSSETDWLAVRLGGELATDMGWKFTAALRHVYTSGDIYQNAEWIDGFVVARLCAVFAGIGADVKNLSEGVPGLDVWPQTMLGESLVHHKGPKGKQRLMENRTT